MSYTEEMFTEEGCEAAWNYIRGHSIKWDDLHESNRQRYRDFANALPAKRKGEPIEAKNIRVGDKIERVHEVSDGVTVTFSAVVGRINDYGNIYTEEDGYIANIEDSGHFNLVHRPKPKLEVGQVIRVNEVSIAEANGLVGREFSVVHIEGNLVDVILPSHKRASFYLDDFTAFTVLWPTEES